MNHGNILHFYRFKKLPFNSDKFLVTPINHHSNMVSASHYQPQGLSSFQYWNYSNNSTCGLSPFLCFPSKSKSTVYHRQVILDETFLIKLFIIYPLSNFLIFFKIFYKDYMLLLCLLYFLIIYTNTPEIPQQVTTYFFIFNSNYFCTF